MKKILVVENDTDTSELMEHVLDNAGYKVIRSDIKIPMDDLLKINPALILLDHYLTDGYGGDYCAEIKTNHHTKHIPVVLVSAVHKLEKVSEAACADGFIKKPFDIVLLQETIKKFICLVCMWHVISL
jgi:two-component system phosphate regulon response regulator PhoB